MTLPLYPNQLSLSSILNEFKFQGPIGPSGIGFGNLYRGGSIVGSGQKRSFPYGTEFSIFIPISGQISLTNFHGSTSAYYSFMQKKTADDQTTGAAFGRSVAISDDGNTMIVGADLDIGVSGQANAGSAYILVKSGGSWVQQAKIRSSLGTTADARFGYSVAISSDGNTVLIGAPQISAASTDGHAQVWFRSNGSWSLQSTLSSSPFLNFGFSVSLSADGNTAAVGGRTFSPRVLIFTRSGSSWSSQQSIFYTDIPAQTNWSFDATTQFANSVSLSSDGNSLLVGHPRATFEQIFRGCAHLYTRSGGVWSYNKFLPPIVINATIELGWNVKISGDGNVIVLGADTTTETNFDNFETYAGAGSVECFRKINSVWEPAGRIAAPDPNTNEFFGLDLALSSNGFTLIVGARATDGTTDNQQGSVYIFTLMNNAVFSLRDEMFASDFQTNHQYGRGLALTSDAQTLVVGAPFDDSTPTTDNGAVYVYTKS